ncbi:MAG TPA: hypothetical protein VMF10_01685 [Candidatus Aquilonibacter sp.]|nr:hypothetical protein [Candidatus Aquilonibacter sp.]
MSWSQMNAALRFGGGFRAAAVVFGQSRNAAESALAAAGFLAGGALRPTCIENDGFWPE